MVPLAERYLSLIRGLFNPNAKALPVLVPIEAAGAIAETQRAYESFDVSKGTLRGLHYQLPHTQAKLCRVVEGEAFDVAVDIRLGSPTFGQWAGVKLSAESHNLIYIPPGFAHGFLALTDTVQFLYKCSDLYSLDDEHGVLWNDPELNIAWGIAAPLVSEKDSKLPRLADVARELLPRYDGKVI